MRLCILLFFAALPALAQEPNVQRELIQRQQQSDSFNQQLRQSQERLAVPPGDLRGQQRMDARQLSEKQSLDNLNTQQLRDTQIPRQPELRPYDRDNATAARRPFTSPIVEVPVKPAPPPDRLEPQPKGDITPLEPPH
jgi:hypothetical protein